MKITIFFIIALAVCSCNFAPGSYPYAEVYMFDVSEEELIIAIEKFKNDNPNNAVPTFVGLTDGRETKKTDKWYHIWFYYPERNEIVYTWIRDNNNKTSFALISINEGTQLGNWKRINKDFSHKENKNQKARFERLIKKRIEEYLD